METNLQVFYNEESNVNIRTRMIDNENYFVAKDVCDALGISNSRDAMSRLDEDEKAMSVLPTQFGEKAMNMVNESGLYNLIFQSRKPEARAFRKWVTNVVLPSIRQTGQYRIKGEAECMREQQQRKRLPLPKYRPFFNDWKQRVKPYISRDELENVANTMAVSLSHVRKVYAGTAVSAQIVRVITDEAMYNRKRNVFYPEKKPVCEQMCIEWDEENVEE